jgi:hypothetical protein
MKNCERKEYQLQIIDAIRLGDCKDCPLYKDETCSKHCVTSLLEDMNKEYVYLPRRWGDWELQVLKNIDKFYGFIVKESKNEDMVLRKYDSCESMGQALPIYLPTIKSGDHINIDEELKAHGLSR